MLQALVLENRLSRCALADSSQPSAIISTAVLKASGGARCGLCSLNEGSTTPSGTVSVLLQRPPGWARLIPIRSGLRSGPRGWSAVSDVKDARERIHRRMADRQLLATPASCSRVADCNPNLGPLCGLPPPRGVADCTGHCSMCAAQGLRAVRTRRRPLLPPTPIYRGGGSPRVLNSPSGTPAVTHPAIRRDTYIPAPPG